MSSNINFDAESLIQSQSPMAPFLAIFEQDDDMAVFYAVRLEGATPVVADQLLLTQTVDMSDVVIHWNLSGDRAALIVSERVLAILDYKLNTIFSESIISEIESSWCRSQLEFSPELALEFGIHKFFKQPFLDDSIDAVVSDDNQVNRLLLYKDLLKSKVFVPITTDSPDDPNTLIYTFPNAIDEDVDVKGNLICAFTNMEMFEDQIGQYGLAYQKVSADYLCFGARSFPDILGITITSDSGKSVLISRDEFKLLSLISQPQRMDTNTLLKELGDVFFDDIFDENRDLAQSFVNKNIAGSSIFRSGYYCQPKVGESKPLLCLVVTSSDASEELIKLVSSLKDDGIQAFCDCHVFSLSDILAQSLEQSKQSL